jgi:hypothetical protein
VKKEEEWEEFFEDDATRELKQIFQGQAAMAETVRELHRKMDEIIGERSWESPNMMVPYLLITDYHRQHFGSRSKRFRIQFASWIRIRFRNANPDLDGDATIFFTRDDSQI